MLGLKTALKFYKLHIQTLSAMPQRCLPRTLSIIPASSQRMRTHTACTRARMHTHTLLFSSYATSGVSWNFSFLRKKSLDVLHAPKVGQGPQFHTVALLLKSFWHWWQIFSPSFVKNMRWSITHASHNALYLTNMQKTVAPCAFIVYHLCKNTLTSMRAGSICHIFPRNPNSPPGACHSPTAWRHAGQTAGFEFNAAPWPWGQFVYIHLLACLVGSQTLS